MTLLKGTRISILIEFKNIHFFLYQDIAIKKVKFNFFEEAKEVYSVNCFFLFFFGDN